MSHVWSWDFSDEVAAVFAGDCSGLVVLDVDQCSELGE